MADNFDGFSVNLFQDEDGDWLAHLVEMPGISAFADTPDRSAGRVDRSLGSGQGKLSGAQRAGAGRPCPERIQRSIQRAD